MDSGSATIAKAIFRFFTDSLTHSVHTESFYAKAFYNFVDGFGIVLGGFLIRGATGGLYF